MPYIAFDLNALDAAPHVARAGGITEDAAVAGLARMWAWCWREKTDIVTPVAVRGFFGADVTEPLTAFRFLEVRSNIYRVRGCDRYLRLAEARSKNGKRAAESGNLKRGKASPTAMNTVGELLEERPNNLPGSSPTEPQQLPSPFIEHRASNVLTASQSDQPNSEAVKTLALVPIAKIENAPRKKSAQEKFCEWFEERRIEVLGSDWIPDVHWTISMQNKFCSEIVKRFDPELVARAVELYVSEPQRQSQAPPSGILNFTRDFGKYLALAKREIAQ